jgi:hypothetical protein
LKKKVEQIKELNKVLCLQEVNAQKKLARGLTQIKEASENSI